MARTPQPLHRDPVAGLLLILALPMLVAGLMTPAISITTMVVFSDTLLGGCSADRPRDHLGGRSRRWSA